MALFASPLTSMTLTYGFRDKRYPSHTGADFHAPTGTPVRAAEAGTARPYYGQNGGGNVVELTHANGDKSYYSHLQRWIVKRGQRVKAGQVIGYSGATGNVTGPHLHLGVMRDGRWIDPVKWLKAGAKRQQAATRLAELKKTLGVLGWRASKPRRKQGQTLLKKWGLYDGRIDGINGPLTKKGTAQLVAASK